MSGKQADGEYVAPIIRSAAGYAEIGNTEKAKELMEEATALIDGEKLVYDDPHDTFKGVDRID